MPASPLGPATPTPRTTSLEHLVPVSTVGRGRGLRGVFGPQRTELSVCGVGVAGMGSSLLRASDCPSNSGSLGPTHGHCTDGETEAQRNQDRPGWVARAAELSGLPLGPLLPIFQGLGLCLREAGHILLVAEQPCWEVLPGVRLSPKAPGAWDGAQIPLLLPGPRGCLVPPVAREAGQLLPPLLGPRSPRLSSWAGTGGSE